MKKLIGFVLFVLVVSLYGCGDSPINVEEVNVGGVQTGEICPFCFQSETELYEHCEILIGTTEEG